jgi:glutamate--cysteine ligase
VRRNLQTVAVRGREPGLLLERGGRNVPLVDWAADVLAQCEPIPALLDRHFGGAAYGAAYQSALALVRDPSTTPSARVLHALARNHDNSFLRFALIQSTAHKAMLQHLALPREVRERFLRLAQESIVQQRELEAADEVDFETFRQRYLAADLLRV